MKTRRVSWKGVRASWIVEFLETRLLLSGRREHIAIPAPNVQASPADTPAYIFTPLNYPNNDAYTTSATGISGNTVVGYYANYESQGAHGFIYNDSTDIYTPLNDPDAVNDTWANGISGNTIVGGSENNGFNEGYIYNGGTFTTFDDPNGTGGTWALGISGGTILGDYNFTNSVDGFPNYDGFIATPNSTSISGVVFNDRHGDGIDKPGDNGLPGITVSLQKFRDGKPIGHALATTTNAKGDYSFTSLGADTYQVSEKLPRGYALTTPGGRSYTVALAAGQVSRGFYFGDHKIAVA
jgi:hypothetical protein